MFVTALTTLILGAISGAGAWFAWDQNRKGLSVALTVLTLIFAVIAISTAFAGAVAVVVKLLPILLIILVAWLGFKQLQNKSSKPRA
jgi:CHASE2 domain-containing sensor protein